MNPFVEAVIQGCLEVREKVILSSDVQRFTSFSPGHGGDISSGFDLLAESILYTHLHPFGSVFSEESGWMDETGECNIILDPIDGSDNFSSFFPYYGISVAREVDGVTQEGIVCNLANADVFVRTPDAYYRTSLNALDERLPIITHPSAKIGLFEKAPEHPELVRKLMRNQWKFRSPGALALSLAYAPYVKYVLFLGTMRSYDIQAGLYLSKHLHVFSDERYILISADKELFEQIRFMVEKEYF